MVQQPQTLQGYGYVPDNDESLKSKSGGKFGGNFGNAFLTKFAFNPNVAKEGEPVRPSIEVEVTVGDRAYKTWINPITQVIVKDVTYTEFTTPEVIAEYNAQMIQQNAVVTHMVKAVGVSEEALRNALQNGVASFTDYAQKVCALLPVGYDKKPLDVFLEYQWNFGKKQDGSLNEKTYPTLPKNMKGGYFIVPAQPGTWKEVIAEDGSLTYQNNAGAVHPFERDAAFMASKKGTQQSLNEPAASTPMSQMTPGAAQQSGW